MYPISYFLLKLTNKQSLYIFHEKKMRHYSDATLFLFSSTKRIVILFLYTLQYIYSKSLLYVHKCTKAHTHIHAYADNKNCINFIVSFLIPTTS